MPIKGLFDKNDFFSKRNELDVVYTPRNVAREIVNYFKPAGKVVDPCSGDGAFLDFMPGADWCEIEKGRDFFKYKKQVDWVVGNPPYSIFDPFMDHAFSISQNVLFLIPMSKPFVSYGRMRSIWKWGGY